MFQHSRLTGRPSRQLNNFIKTRAGILHAYHACKGQTEGHSGTFSGLIM